MAGAQDTIFDTETGDDKNVVASIALIYVPDNYALEITSGGHGSDVGAVALMRARCPPMLWSARNLAIANQLLPPAMWASGGGFLAQSILSLGFDGGFARRLCVCLVTQSPKHFPGRNLLLGMGRCRGTVRAT